MDKCELFTVTRTLRFLPALLLLGGLLHGCASFKMAPEQPLPLPPPLQETIERNDFLVSKGTDVIGQLAVIRLEEGDTLPDIARHFSLGINAISAANPGVDPWVPEAGRDILLPLSFILPDAPRQGIVINVASMRLFQFRGEGDALAVSTFPIGIGTTERPTPTGQMFIERKMVRPTWYVPASVAEDHRKKGDPLPAKVPPGPLNPLGEYALYLSKAGYLIHGTNKPASIGLRATNGCIRLYPEDIKKLFESTPVKTPVRIVHQPYLVGQRDGVIYIEAHAPVEGSGALEREKTYAKLKTLERELGRTFDWKRVQEVMEKTQGIPVPILETNPGSQKGVREPIALKHPGILYGKPEVPELKADAWYVLAFRTRDVIEAKRMAAIINHQGPPIPARVMSDGDNHRVIAGPFDSPGEAKEVMKRLRVDLGIDGILVEPLDEK